MCDSIEIKKIAMVLVFVVLVGCGGSDPAEVDRSVDQLSLFGQNYARYLAQFGNAPPDEKRLREFFETQDIYLDRYGIASLDDFFVSSRDKQPLVVAYGEKALVEGPGGLPWVACERAGVDGKRLIVGARGSVEEMTNDQIEKIFPASSTRE